MFILLLLFISLTAALPITVKIPGRSVQCLYTEVTEPRSRIGFYYAVVSGGSEFFVDLHVSAPNGATHYEESGTQEGEFGFTVENTGEYEFCLINADKELKEVELELLVDLPNEEKRTIMNTLGVESNEGVGTYNSNGELVRARLPISKGVEGEEKLESSINILEEKTQLLNRLMSSYKVRNKRNESTVNSTEYRIFWFSVLDLSLMLGMAALHVGLIHFYFYECEYLVKKSVYFLCLNLTKQSSSP